MNAAPSPKTIDAPKNKKPRHKAEALSGADPKIERAYQGLNFTLSRPVTASDVALTVRLLTLPVAMS